MLGRATILKKLLSRLSGIFASCPLDFRGRLLNQESCLRTCGKMKHTPFLLRNAKDRRRINGDSFCFRSWPERLEPSPAARTQIFRENLSLPDSGWPRFVRMFEESSAQGFLAVAPGGQSQSGFPAPLTQRGRKPSCVLFSGRTFAFNFKWAHSANTLLLPRLGYHVNP